MGIHFATAEDRERTRTALKNPERKHFADPLDPRLEGALGRARVRGEISEAEYRAGVKWQNVHSAYMHSIMSPDDMTDIECERAAQSYKRGIAILENVGMPGKGIKYGKSKRVLHAVNAIAVFDEPEELGDYEYTLKAARVGLSALALTF